MTLLSTTSVRTAALLACFVAAGIAAQPHHAVPQQPTIWVGCADGTACDTAPLYRDGATVNARWTHLAPQPLNDPGALL